MPRVQRCDQQRDVLHRGKIPHREERFRQVFKHQGVFGMHGEAHLQRVPREMRQPSPRREPAELAPQTSVTAVDLHGRGVTPKGKTVGFIGIIIDRTG